MKILDKLIGKRDLGLDKPSYTPLANDELGLGEIKSDDFTNSSLPPDEVGPSFSPFRNAQPLGQPTAGPQSRDIELILSRLDTIRSLLTNLDLRIARLEKVAGVEEKDKRW